MDLSIFQDILSQYPNADHIKSGGQKATFRASHPKYGVVALKVGQCASLEGLERIKREVMLLRDIDSKYYPKNYEFDVLSGDRFIIVEEFIESRPLSECFDDFQDPKTALGLVKELVIALSIIWEKNVVHLDNKPDNILITPEGIPKIIDLGIARLLDLTSLTHDMAQRGPCTPFYAAPEQLSNRKTKITFRTDQFCLGIILAQLLLKGQHPFDPSVVGAGTSIVDNILKGRWHHSPLSSDELSAALPLATRLLGNEPYQRFPNPKALIRSLDLAVEAFV